MKLLSLILLLLLVPVLASAQVMIRYEWSQPDSTMPHTIMSGGQPVVIPSVPLHNGDLAHYLVWMAAAGDTTQTALIPAPPTLAELATANFPVPVGQVVSFAVAAVDVRGKTGPRSLWSEPFMVEAGAPQSPGQPVPRVVFLGE